jgi:Universal stress protein family
VLVRLSAHASLLVLGTREPVLKRPYLGGSISHYCISHAQSPVVVVPESRPQRRWNQDARAATTHQLRLHGD